MKILCNPLNLNYVYQHYGKGAHREAADPTLLYWKGQYYLFASMSSGFFYSKDLINWERHNNRNLELYHYAPDVRVIGDSVIFSASDRIHSSVWVTDDLFAEEYKKTDEPFTFWDPNAYLDDDGRLYFYWGCNCGVPLYGTELDRETLLPKGDTHEILRGLPREHGFERTSYPGLKQKEKTAKDLEIEEAMRKMGFPLGEPFIEGSFMNKINGRYYFQYAGPGTEFDTYGDGVYVGDAPFGPLTYQKHNPFSSRPSGFITGAGHGSTIEDEYGNLWHASTMVIGVNANFERRVGLFPAGVDEDGILYCNQNYADWPLYIPDGKFDARDIKPDWMLVSYKKNAEASSAIDGHPVSNALDECIKTSWAAQSCKGEWFKLDLGDTYKVHAIQINFADVDVPLMEVDPSERSDVQTNNRYIDSGTSLVTRYILEYSVDGVNWETLEDKSNTNTDLPHDLIVCEEGVEVRFLKITFIELPYDKKAALSGFRVFAEPKGTAPGKVVDSEYHMVDDMSLSIRWPRANGAIGYNIRYGIAPDKLYSSYMVYDKCDVVITTLNKGTEYYYEIDSFGEGGTSEGTPIKVEL